jgi:D-alanyl-lipoteichoic acid acyltransferase DltB (MBOAT superfamily)
MMGPVICVLFTNKHLLTGLQKSEPSSYRCNNFYELIVINLTQLLLLKYVTFTINPVFELLNIDLDFTVISRIIIPVGVSFFTLQGIGYLINVNLGWEKPEKNFIHFLLYISFFPRFLSGPIDRSNHFLPQLRINKTFDGKNIAAGFRLILFGLFSRPL